MFQENVRKKDLRGKEHQILQTRSENSNYLKIPYLWGMAGRPPIFDTPEQLENLIQAYFDEKQEKVTVTGLAYHLGFESRQSIYDYKERLEFSYIIKRATLWIESMYEEKLSGNNVAGSVFALKNMGWKDKQETEHSGSIDTRPIQYAPQPGNEPIKD